MNRLAPRALGGILAGAVLLLVTAVPALAPTPFR